MQGAHYLKAFWAENVRKNEPQPRKTTENRDIKGLTFLVLIFLIFLFYYRILDLSSRFWGGFFSENPNLRSKFQDFGVQRPKIRKN